MILNDLDKDLVYYLASPYSTPYDPATMHCSRESLMNSRHEQILDIEAKLIRLGFITYGPIVTSHALAQRHNLGNTFESWEKRDKAFIRKLDGLLVAKLPMWERSKGVSEEIKYAIKLDKPVYLLDVEFDNREAIITKVHQYYVG